VAETNYYNEGERPPWCQSPLRFTRIKHFQCANGSGTTSLDPEFFEYFLDVLFHRGLGDARIVAMSGWFCLGQARVTIQQRAA